MLTVQSRMHAHIMAWASRELYGGRLTAADAVAGHTLADLQARPLAWDSRCRVMLNRVFKF